MGDFFVSLAQILADICGGKRRPQQGPDPQKVDQYLNQARPPVQTPYPPQQPPQIVAQNQQQYQQPYYPQQQQQQHQQQTWSQVASHANGHQPQQQHHQQQNHQQQNHHQPDNHQTNGQYPSHQQDGGYAHDRPPGLPAGGVVGPHHPHYQNQDLINSTNERYTQMRNQARHEGDEAHKCFAQSQQAYQHGNGARAHELSEEGKAHDRKQDQMDDEASMWIFNENNKQSPPGTIDLHGLYVKEAIERTESAISQAQSSGQMELRVIVGKGIHSQGHVARIKPAVEELMQKYNLSAHLDPHNSGVLIVNLAGEGGMGRSRDAGGLVDEMGKQQDDGCVIM